MKKYSHAYNIAFEVVSTDPTGETDTAQMLIDGLQARLDRLRGNDDEILEACGLPFDTYEVEEGNEDVEEV